jgi:anaerobic magnesium-protoporphyrin IX monomethyl ester cyclase
LLKAQEMSDVLLVYQNIGEIKIDSIFTEVESIFFELAKQRGLVGIAAGTWVPPNVLMTIASYLKQGSISVSILDLSLEYFEGNNVFSTLKSVLKKEDPQIIGLSIMEVCFLSHYKKIVSIIREYNPNIKIVAGGLTATSMEKDMLYSELFDIIVRGEGEITFTELCNCLLKEKELSGVKGISYLVNGNIKRTESRGFMDLNKLLLPLREIYPLKRLYKINNNIDLVYTSRGCPYNCSFCNAPSFWNREWRGRKPEDVIEELRYVEEHGGKIVHIHDLNFAVNKKWVEKICEGIHKEGLDLLWDCQLRADFMESKLLQTLYTSNCRGAYVGIEAAKQDTLDGVNKGYSINQLNKGLENAKNIGIHVDGGYVVGLPDDTKESMYETKNLAIKLLKEDLAETPAFFIFVPWKGTAIGDNPNNFGIEIVNQNYDDWHQFTTAPIASTKYETSETVYTIWRNGWNDLLDILKSKIASSFQNTKNKYE